MSEPRDERALSTVMIRIVLLLTAIAVSLALVLLFRETAYTFVLFMFLGPPLIGISVFLLGLAAWRELKTKHVL